MVLWTCKKVYSARLRKIAQSGQLVTADKRQREGQIQSHERRPRTA